MDNLSYRDGKPHIYLKPGELCISETEVVVTTVLGSCVSVTLYHRPSKLASICHAMQPRCPQQKPDLDQCPTKCKGRYRYATCSVEDMVKRMLSHGLRPKDIEVKLFGGAALIGTRSAGSSGSVGQLNVKAAMETISRCGLVLKVMDVGGNFGRKIIFNTSTGDILMKRLHRANVMDLGS